MTIWQGRSKRKTSGGIIHLNRIKRRFEISEDPIKPVIGNNTSRIKKRGYGNNPKIKMVMANNVNVIDNLTHKARLAKLVTVKENNSNPHYVQRNILNKGVVVETDIGMVKITSRPSQDGVLNGILVKASTAKK